MMRQVVKKVGVMKRVDVESIQTVNRYAYWYEGSGHILVYYRGNFGFSNLSTTGLSMSYIENKMGVCVTKAIERDHEVFEFDTQKDLARWMLEHP